MSKLETQARLPAELYDTSGIKDMPFGEWKYTVPWAMQVDMDGLCWINAAFTVEDQRSGTVTMGVLRDAGGVSVQIRDLDYLWTPTASLGEGIVGGKEYIRVTHVHLPESLRKDQK